MRRRALNILSEPYTGANFWWQLYQLGVRTTLTSCFVLLRDEDRFSAVTALNALVLCLHVLRRPYADDADTHWETASLLVLTVVTAALSSRAASVEREGLLAALVIVTAVVMVIRTAGGLARASYKTLSSAVLRLGSAQSAADADSAGGPGAAPGVGSTLNRSGRHAQR